MSNEFDIARLLAPISDDAPAGGNIEYEPIFERISAARESDTDYPEESEWGGTARQADWPLVSTLCLEVLEKRSKDLQIACWFTEAQGQLHGLSGIERGLHLITQLIAAFWPTLYPLLEEGVEEAEVRIGRLEWLDKQLSKQLGTLSLCKDGRLTFNAWQRIQYFEQRVAVDSTQAELLRHEGYYSARECDSSIRETPSAFFSELLGALAALKNTLVTLQTTLAQQVLDAPPLLSESEKKWLPCVS